MDDNQIFCGCPVTFDNVQNLVYTHAADCPYRYGDVSWDHWILLQSTRQRNCSQDLDEQTIGDYVPCCILKTEEFNTELLNYRKSRLFQNHFGGGRRNILQFKEARDKIIQKAFNGGAHFKVRRFHLVEKVPGSKVTNTTKLRDVLGSLALVLENVINETKLESKRGDKVQVIISTEKTPAYWGDTGMDHPVATPFFAIHDLSENVIIPFLFKYFEKYEHITIGDQLKIETVLIRGAHNVPPSEDDDEVFGDLLDLRNTLKRMKGVIQIKNNDTMCFARAVIVGYYFNNLQKCTLHSEEYKYALNEYESVRHGSDRFAQTAYAILLCQFADIKPFTSVNRDCMLKVASFLHVQIKIVEFESKRVTTKIGDESQTCIYLLRRKVFLNSDSSNPNMWKSFIYHFDTITNMRVFKGSRYYCTFCDLGFNNIQSHKCFDKFETWCFCCYNRVCLDNGNVRKCDVCESSARSDLCLERHKQLKICHLFWCSKCGKTFPKIRNNDNVYESYFEAKERHRCFVKCKVCGRERVGIHKCYMLRQPFYKPVTKLLFFDFETDQSSGVHLPVYCYMKWVEIKECANNVQTIIKKGEKEFGVNYAVCKDVGDFLFHKQFQDFTFIAHNLKGFDGCFLLQYLIENGVHAELIANGLKLTSITIPHFNIRMIDSLNFLQMRLADMPTALGIDDSLYSKGYFPHFFTSPDNLTYVGRIPPPEFYGCFDMKDKHYAAFMKWYSQNQNTEFNFQNELKVYCKQDVTILLEGCLKFRNLMIDITRNITKQPNCLDDESSAIEERNNEYVRDPANNDKNEGNIDVGRHDEFDTDGVCDPFAYLTAPGVCSAIFKAKFLKQNAVAQILPSGYEHQRHSLVSCEYMEYLHRSKYNDIQFILNTQDGKEIQIGKYRVDGFVPSLNKIIEFNGCFWHGCPYGCISNMHSIHPVRQQTYLSLYEDTQKRALYLKSRGYSVDEMWECQWESLKQTDETIKAEVDSIFIKRRLCARDAFKGGRTETGLLIYDIQNSRFGLGLYYMDICSLYPSVNCQEEYPVGHPEIITCNFNLDISKYFGLIQCQVLPPQTLKNGVLPEHVNGKLLFPLCRMCAHNHQIRECRHTEEQRSLFGVWVSEELKQAVESGYEIKRIYCVHHFKRRSRDLFSNYMHTFFKLKLITSERPDNETAEEFDQFIQIINTEMKLNITKDDFISNAGIRLLAKLCLNCLWGRLGMRDAFPSVHLVRSFQELLILMNNPTRTITTIRYLSSKCLAVLSTNKSVDTVNISNNTNIYLAVFTTAYARIRLYNLIKQVEDRFVYCDTDSIIFEANPDETQNLKTGKYLGDLTNELKYGEVITDFVSGGPKVYAYKTNKNNCVVKIKGFQICKANSAAFSFDNLKRIIMQYVKTNLDNETGRVKSTEMSFKALRRSIFENHHQGAKNSNAVALENAISTYNVNKIRRTNTWTLLQKAEQKVYTPMFNKRIILHDYRTVPFGYRKNCS